MALWRRTTAATPPGLDSLVGVMLLLSMLISNAMAQTCSCSPTAFTFTLDYDGICPGNIRAVDGIERTTCAISDTNFQPVSPEIPINITSIDILEFGLDLDLLSRTTLPGPFEDGDEIDFVSIVAAEDLERDDAVNILQFAINGVNENQVAIRNSLGIVYSNECEVEPIFSEGDEIGWIVFSDVGDASDDLCQASPTGPPVTGPPTAAPDTSECSCSPRSFTFQFNFEGECPGNVEPDDAIESVGCIVENDFGDQVEDNVPVEVTKITIQEVTDRGTLVAKGITNVIFLDGEVFEYTSVATEGETSTMLQIILQGSNNIGVGLFNEVRIQYTNECDEPVVFESDAAIGWLQIEEFVEALPAACEEPLPPSVAPTPEPTPEENMSFDISRIREMMQRQDESTFGRLRDTTNHRRVSS